MFLVKPVKSNAAVAKAHVDSIAFAARLKSCPFKNIEPNQLQKKSMFLVKR